MDNFRKYRAPHKTPRAVDGFVGSAPRGSAARTPRPTRTATGSSPSLSDFRGSDGFRPNTQPKLATNGARSPEPKKASEQPIQRMSPMEMRLPETKQKKRSGKSIFRRAGKVLTVLFVIGLLGGGYFIGRAYLAVHGVLKGGGSAPALAKSVDVSELKGEGDGRINVLLLGIGGAGHDGADLTDTIILASIDPVNNKAALMSIPRDLWVKMPNNFIADSQKINAAYESGKYKKLGRQDSSNADRKAIEAGFDGVDKVIETVLGVPVHYNVLVNFKAFQQGVDTVGGVTVTVPESLVDPTMAWENGGSATLARAGTQTFKGKQALMYVRSRATSSDFARSQRQRAVMVALKDKVFTLGTLSNPTKISGLINTFGDNVVSDLSVADAARLGEIMKKISNDKIQSVGLTDAKTNLVTTGNMSGLSIVQPRAGMYNYAEIQSYARNVLKDGYIENENANIAVLNGSNITGLAGQKANDLKSYGYNITNVGNAPTKNYSKTVIVDLTNGQKKVTKHYLEQRFGVPVVTTMPDATIPTSGSDFVIILGQNEKST